MIDTRSLDPEDRTWLIGALEEEFVEVSAARRGALVDASILPGFVATEAGRRVGFLTYDVVDGACEVVAIGSSEHGRGIGWALMNAVRDHAVSKGCHRLWLITTNDNVRAFRFYQLWGMDLCAFYRNAVSRSRALKPTIPQRGQEGIPLAHELEFELLLRPQG